MAGLFVGGTTRITWNYAGEGTKTFTFTIGGQNATKTQFKNYLGTTPWFLHKMVQLESTFLQFNPNNTPNFGAPHGYGLMQVEKPLEQAEGIYIVWHWQANVQAGTRVLNSKNTPSYQFWIRQVEQWQAWNAANAANPSLQVGLAPKVGCAAIGCVAEVAGTSAVAAIDGDGRTRGFCRGREGSGTHSATISVFSAGKTVPTGSSGRLWKILVRQRMHKTPVRISAGK